MTKRIKIKELADLLKQGDNLNDFRELIGKDSEKVSIQLRTNGFDPRYGHLGVTLARGSLTNIKYTNEKISIKSEIWFYNVNLPLPKEDAKSVDYYADRDRMIVKLSTKGYEAFELFITGE